MNDGNEDSDDDLDSPNLFGIAGTKPLTFHPIYTVSVWKDPTSKDQRVSMAILLPTGIGENPGDLKLFVEDDEIFKITIRWPSAMVSVPQLMQRWLSSQEEPEMKDYHPQVQGFYSFLENFQSKEGDPIYSTARIGLPFSMNPDFERILLGSEGTKQIVLFVTLGAPDHNYKKNDDMLIVQVFRAPELTNPSLAQGVSTISNK